MTPSVKLEESHICYRGESDPLLSDISLLSDTVWFGALIPI